VAIDPTIAYNMVVAQFFFEHCQTNSVAKSKFLVIHYGN
jgi:hypothetical protein